MFLLQFLLIWCIILNWHTGAFGIDVSIDSSQAGRQMILKRPRLHERSEVRDEGIPHSRQPASRTSLCHPHGSCCCCCFMS